MRLSKAGVMVVLCGLAAPVLAQVAPPPTQAPPKTPEFTPPADDSQDKPKVVPKGVPAQKTGVDPNKEKMQKMVSERRIEGSLKLPEGFNSTLLVKRDENGKLVRYDRPLAWIAYENNPLITDARRNELSPSLERRQLMYEIGMVNNLDLIMKVDQGEFDRLDYRDRRAISWAERTKRALRSGGMLSEWMYTQGFLTEEQAAGCQELANKYAQAALVEARDSAGDDRVAQTLAFTRYFYNSQVEEGLYVYRRLLERAADNVQDCVDSAELPPDVYESVKPEVETVKAAKTPEEKRAAMNALLQKIPDWVMQHRLMDRAISLKFVDRGTRSGDKMVYPVMAYQVETQHRAEREARGEPVQYQKEPARPAK